MRLRHPDFCLALLLAAVAVASPLLGGGFGVIGASILEILIGIIGLVLLAGPGRDHLRLPAAGVLLALLVLLAILSMPGSESLYQSLRYLLLLLSCLIIFLAVNAAAGRMEVHTYLSTAVATAGALLSVMAMREYAAAGGGWRVFGTFANPNYFSGFLVMTFPVTLALYIASRGGIFTILLASSGIFQIAALLMTGARFGVAAGAAGVAAFVFLSLLGRSLDRNGLKRLVILILLSVPLLIIAARPVAERVGGGAPSQAHSLPFRIYTWRGTVRMIFEHPANGTGAGTFEIAFPRYAIAGYTRTSHETFLQAGAEMGIMAPIVLFIALASLALRIGSGALGAGRSTIESGWNLEFRTSADEWIQGKQARALILCGIFGGLLASSARNLIDSDWYLPALAITFWLLAGWGTALASGLSPQARRPRAGPIAFGILCTVLIALAAIMLIGGALAKSGSKAKSASDLDAAARDYMRAVRVIPFAADYHYELAKIHLEQGETGLALGQLRRAALLEPTRSRYRYDIALALADQGRFEMAVREMNRAIELDPHAPRPKLALAGLYEAMGNRDAALSIYRKLSREESAIFERLKGVPELVEPAYAIANYHLAVDARRRGSLREAEKYLIAAIDRLERRRKAGHLLIAARIAGLIAPEDERSLHELLITCHRTLADIYARSGEPVRAKEHMKRAEKLEKEKAPDDTGWRVWQNWILQSKIA